MWLVLILKREQEIQKKNPSYSTVCQVLSVTLFSASIFTTEPWTVREVIHSVHKNAGKTDKLTATTPHVWKLDLSHVWDSIWSNTKESTIRVTTKGNNDLREHWGHRYGQKLSRKAEGGLIIITVQVSNYHDSEICDNNTDCQNTKNSEKNKENRVSSEQFLTES